MAASRRFALPFALACLGLLTACGGGGGSSAPAASPLSDNGGLWVGSWAGTGAAAGYNGLVVAELHQSGTALTGYCAVTDGSLPSGNNACTGTISGAQIQFGVLNNQVGYTGTLAGTHASGNYQDTSTSSTGNWSIFRYLGPFDGTAAPAADLSGTWTFNSTSSTKGAQPAGSLTLSQSGQDLSGYGQQGSNSGALYAGRTAGTTAWFAAQYSSSTLVVAWGTMTGTTGSGSYVKYDSTAAANPVDQGTWTATKP